MQRGGGEKPVPVDCISLLNLNWLISSPMAHVPKRARCLHGYSEDGVTRQAMNRGHDLIKSRGGGFKIAVCHKKDLMKFCLLI